jgi:hypothetical protein
MATVTGGPFTRGGAPLRGVVRYQLIDDTGPLDEAVIVATDEIIVGTRTAVLDDNGLYTVALPSNDELDRAGTRWERTTPADTARTLYVPVDGGNEDDLYADPPGEIGSAALATHAADTSLHGAGQEIAIAQPDTDTSTTGPITDVAGASITFEAPDRPYEVELWLPVVGSVTGVICTVLITHVQSGVALATQNFRAGVNGDLHVVATKVRVPSLVFGHAPTPGDVATYKAQIARNGAAGLATTDFDLGPGVVVRDAFIAARTR